MRRISATDFKAKCLALVDEVARTGEPLEVHKRGKPVVRVVQAPADGSEFPQDSLKGTVTVCGDIVAPVLPPEAWEVLDNAEGKESNRVPGNRPHQPRRSRR